ncbi:MAG: STAS domain-containing protein [Clostridia bacterium]|nr:STAS domain-containing protein [Clostridia bacterium]MBO7249918.1 STAS domain-containing protein [Clostridia bacterium]
MLFRPKLFDTFKSYNKNKLISDITAGLIVAIIALPLSIALAIASGVSPERGLYTAIVAGFVIAALGGSNVNISGPTAAFATIVAGIVATEGLEGLVIATVLAGIILILMGLLKLGSLIKYIPITITTGFTAGIALTIIIGQVKDFLGLTFSSSPIETPEKVHAIVESISTLNLAALLLGLAALAVLIVWPKISKKIPGSLVVVILGALAVKFLNINVNTIGDLYQITSALPTPSLPAISLEKIIHLLPNAFTIAILAGIESLLSCVVSDGMINDRHNSNTELVAQGVGNICSGIFGGIPATGAIARTAANVKNGGRSPISGIVHAVVLFLVLVVLMPLAAWIPMPIIAAILFMVAYNMSEWKRFVHICKTATASEIIVLVVTFSLTVIFDLVVAIAIGLILTAFLFMKKMADSAQLKMISDVSGREIPKNTVIYELNGPMFFAASDKFLDFPRDDNVRVMILDATGLSMLDATTIQNIDKLIVECKKDSITLIVCHIAEAPLSTLKRSNLYEIIGDENFCKDIDSAIARTKEILEK